MKRKILGLAVVVLAISLSAFKTRPEHSSFAQYYWFPLEAGTGRPKAVYTLVYQSYDPYFCTSWAWGDYCAGAYTGYTGSGPYYPSGMNVFLDFSIIP